MYILKNAWTNIKRNKGRNILIGIIVLIITTSSFIALAINTSGNKLIKTYQNQNQLEVSLNLNMQKLKKAEEKEKLTEEEIKNYANSKYISSYYYTKETSLSSDSINPVDLSEMFEEDAPKDKPDNAPNNNQEKEQNNDQGDFKLTAYSDTSYIDNFTEGTSKITKGKMISQDSTDDEVIISKELAEENNLKVGDTITLTSNDATYEFKIIGIFKTENNTDNFMNMNALNSQNQIYTTITAINKVLENQDNDNLNVKFYLKNTKDLNKFKKELKSKGLSSYYQVVDNTTEIENTLKPIKNISSFSLTFLIIILVLGLAVLIIINILNIRNRKYEIGVLRSIGMSKMKLLCQLSLELLIVAIISFILATALGYTLSQPVTNKILENEINSYQTSQTEIENNFGSKGFERPNRKELVTTNYVDNLTISLNANTVLLLFGTTILIVLITTSVSVIYLTKYEPNKILRNRN